MGPRGYFAFVATKTGVSLRVALPWRYVVALALAFASPAVVQVAQIFVSK